MGGQPFRPRRRRRIVLDNESVSRDVDYRHGDAVAGGVIVGVTVGVALVEPGRERVGVAVVVGDAAGLGVGLAVAGVRLCVVVGLDVGGGGGATGCWPVAPAAFVAGRTSR